jgi:hypothetical protein
MPWGSEESVMSLASNEAGRRQKKKMKEKLSFMIPSIRFRRRQTIQKTYLFRILSLPVSTRGTNNNSFSYLFFW